MRDLRPQYFFTFAMLGGVLPYASPFLKERGLTETQIGFATALSSVAVVLSPGIVSGIADRQMDPRKLLAGLLVVSAAALGVLSFTSSFLWILVTWSFYWLVAWPLSPLQDGIFFSVQRQRHQRGEVGAKYHHVRLGGTLGYLLPTLILFWPLAAGASMAVALRVAAGFALLGAAAALLLSDPRDPSVRTQREKVPMFAALRAVSDRHVVVFLVAMILVAVAMVAYSPFYPLYLTGPVGLDRKWLGPVQNIGVVVEIFFMLGAAWLATRLGVKRLLVIGVACIAVRLALLAMSASVWVAVGTQLFHGIQSVVLLVVPPAFIDRHAEDRYRHSMQGLYLVLTGAARSVGGMITGPLAGRDLKLVFAVGAGLCVIAAVVIAVGLRDEE